MNKTIFALGFFDGVHLGHRALLQFCRRIGEQTGAAVGAVTFAAHPDGLVLGSAPVLINTPADREALLLEYVDRVITLPFDRQMLDTPWDAFLDMLRRDYGAAGFVCGDDFRFGARGAGNAQKLAEYCRREQLPCAVASEQLMDGVRISSTHIRTLLEQGDMTRAVRFLGHPHILSGTVVHGRHLGRTLGIPTANLRLPENLVVPRFGVYACIARVNGMQFPAVTNVGTRPTVEGHHITVEPWLLDYSGDLYGQHITLEFHQFLRPEQKFPSLETLQQEIRRNAQQTREYFQPCKEDEDAV